MNLSDAAAQRQPSYLHRLEQLVGIDSGSRDLAGLHAVADLVAGWTNSAGMSTERVTVLDSTGSLLGDAVVARLRGTGTRRILLAGHLDTVFGPGTAARRPYRVDGNIAYGPGVCDDKGGVLAGLAAIECLLATGRTAFGEVILLATPDEEIGSIGSRPLLTQLAGESDVAFCLECARENGDVVHARKGVADIEVTLLGRAAHAGIEPERGANAALAAAGLTIDLQQLNGRWPSVTVNVGVLHAGERSNVVPDQAKLVVDLRADRVDSFADALDEIHALAYRPRVDGVSASVEVIAPTPPWEGSAATESLVKLVAQLGADLGIAIAASSTGGCADANLLAETGIAVLDGLGPVGGDDHSVREWLDLSSVVPRVTLLAELIDAVANGN